MRIDSVNAREIFSSEQYSEFYVIKENETTYLSTVPENRVYAILPKVTAQILGDDEFKRTYHTKYSYYAGAMANGISSVKMVVSLGLAGFMGSYGAGGQTLNTIEKAIDEIQAELPNGPYLINVLSNMHNPALEFRMIQMLIQKQVNSIEASAFIEPSEALVYYRLKGSHHDKNGRVVASHNIIAKLSREEVASRFYSPANPDIVKKLVNEGLLTSEEAECALYLPMASDVTVEAESGGHTDNKQLISLLPALIALRNSIQKDDIIRTRVGAAGGIATGSSALAAFAMGADYIVTGSVNQACIESGTSEYVRELLTKVKTSDTLMCPSADMFEIGGRVQVTKVGTMFPLNAQKLYGYYSTYSCFDEIPEKDRIIIEKRILKNSFENVWLLTKEYFQKTDPNQIVHAEENPKVKMALVFRWYLGNSASWAIHDTHERRTDMQIWCGQSMGAYNQWVKETAFQDPRNRKVVSVAKQIMESAAFELNLQTASLAGVNISNFNSGEKNYV